VRAAPTVTGAPRRWSVVPNAREDDDRDGPGGPPVDETHVEQGGYGERTAPTDASGLAAQVERLERHSTRAPDSTGISPPDPRGRATDGPDDEPAGHGDGPPSR
jgi:hypothetical protein